MAHQRQRVTRACDRCRTLKSKCDGAQPNCSRCKTYGYHCTWEMGGRRGFTHDNIQATPGHVSPQSYVASLRRSIQAYDHLLVELRQQMGVQEGAWLDNRLSRIRMTLPAGVLEHQGRRSMRSPEDTSQSASPSPRGEQSFDQTQPLQAQVRPVRDSRTHERSASEPSSYSQPREIRSSMPVTADATLTNFSSATESFVPAPTAPSDLDVPQIPFDFSQYSWPSTFGITESFTYPPQFAMSEFEGPLDLPWDFENSPPS